MSGCSAPRDYSARLAAAPGLPYVFAHHFSGEGTRARSTCTAPASSRRRARGAAHVPHRQRVRRGHREEAYASALPQLQHMARLRTGQRLTALDTVEEPPSRNYTAAAAGRREHGPEWVIDEPVAAASRILELAERFGVDEVMVSPAASARTSDDPRTSQGRVRTLELLAAALGL